MAHDSWRLAANGCGLSTMATLLIGLSLAAGTKTMLRKVLALFPMDRAANLRNVTMVCNTPRWRGQLDPATSGGLAQGICFFRTVHLNGVHFKRSSSCLQLGLSLARCISFSLNEWRMNHVHIITPDNMLNVSTELCFLLSCLHEGLLHCHQSCVQGQAAVNTQQADYCCLVVLEGFFKRWCVLLVVFWKLCFRACFRGRLLAVMLTVHHRPSVCTRFITFLFSPTSFPSTSVVLLTSVDPIDTVAKYSDVGLHDPTFAFAVIAVLTKSCTFSRMAGPAHGEDVAM